MFILAKFIIVKFTSSSSKIWKKLAKDQKYINGKILQENIIYLLLQGELLKYWQNSFQN